MEYVNTTDEEVACGDYRWVDRRVQLAGPSRRVVCYPFEGDAASMRVEPREIGLTTDVDAQVFSACFAPHDAAVDAVIEDLGGS